MPLMMESYAVSGTWLNRPVFRTVTVAPDPPRKDSFAVSCFKKARFGKKGKGVVATRPNPLLTTCGQDSSSVNPKNVYSDDTELLNPINSPASSTDTLVNDLSFSSLDSIYDLYSKMTDTIPASTETILIQSFDEGDSDSSYGIEAVINCDYSCWTSAICGADSLF